MKEQPLISVLLPVHNAADTLAECVLSLLSQSYKNIEIITIDNFSKDNSYSILKALKKKDKRLRVYKNVKRYGIGVNLNRLVKKAKGTYIAFMDTSDISNPNRLKKQLNFLLKKKDVVAVGSQCTFIDEKGKKIGRSDFPTQNSLIYENPLHGISMQFETVLINKTLLPKDVLRFHTGSNPFIYSDIFIKISNYGKFANLKEFLHYHRNNPKIYLSDVKRNIVSLVKLWIKSKALYDYNSPVRSFFSPVIKSA
jgi:glycosyltransferase involved in cell wall biosynthesis